MKNEPLRFKKPYQIFQVFRNINIYGKDEKSFESRKQKLKWKPMLSSSGYVKDGIAYLPQTVLEQPNFDNHDIIVMLEDNIPNPQNILLSSQKNLLFKRRSANMLDAFLIKADEHIEVHLKHGYFEVGLPKRDNFKLCELRINKPVEIMINGKTDFSLTGRRARSFMEQVYILEYLGDFQHYAILKEPYAPVTKEVPLHRKVINLNKTLW